ncbi:MAG: hypothetical protein HRU19_23040 [Pseudobacteriovorax sp.]|nr:hypothetical protein [Pseudobacteriovorax sp.]
MKFTIIFSIVISYCCLCLGSQAFGSGSFLPPPPPPKPSQMKCQGKANVKDVKCDANASKNSKGTKSDGNENDKPKQEN